MITEKVLFFTPVFFANLKIENLDEIVKSVEEKEKIFESAQQSNIGGWQSPMFNEIEDIYSNIVGQLDCLMGEIHLKYELSKVPKFRQYWFNVNKQNNYNYPHTHLGEHFSGVLYLKVPENSGEISFHNPLKSTNLEVVKENEYTCRSHRFTPSVGDVFIFESSLLHSVGKNRSNETRISMAFDYK